MENENTDRGLNRISYSLELERYYLHLLQQRERDQLNMSFPSEAEEFLDNLIILSDLEETLNQRKAA